MNKNISYKMGLKIASINVRGIVNQNATDKRLILKEWIFANDFDIVCIQEWCVQQFNFEVNFPTYLFKNKYNIAINNNNVSTAIIYKKNLAINEVQNIQCGHPGQYITWIRLFSRNKILHIGSWYHAPGTKYINHIDTLTSQLNQLASQSKNTNYFLICGDFNARSYIWDNKEDQRGINVLDWILDNNFSCLNNGQPTHYDAPTKHETAIDLSLVSNNASKLAYNWTIDKNLHNQTNQFDHYGIICYFNFTTIKHNNKLNITFDFKNIQNNVDIQYQYQKQLYHNLSTWKQQWYDLVHSKDNLNIITILFQNAILDAAIRTIGIKKYNNDSKTYLSTKIIKLINQKRTLSKQYKKCKHKRIKKKINYITHTIKKLKIINIKKYQNNIKRRINECKSGDSKLFYQLFYQTTDQTTAQIPTLQTSTGQILAITSDEKAKVLHQHFNRKIAENEYNYHNLQHHQRVSEYVENIPLNNNNDTSILNRFFTQQEISKVISDANQNTAMGYDFIHQKLISYGKDIIIPFITLLFNTVYCIYAQAPDIWKYTNITPIPKPGKDNSLVKNNRPISLLPVLSRLLEKTLANRILTFCIKNNIIHHWNCGFQKNKSTDDILIHLVDNIVSNFENQSITEISFKDLQSAYESVWHDGLFYKLHKLYNIDGNFLFYLKSYLQNRYNRVLLNDTNTQWTQHSAGLPQGGPLSPILWTIYINDILINKNSIKLLALADDMSMYTVASTLTYNNTIDLQSEIDNFYDWTLNWKLVINPDKCSSISLTKLRAIQARVYNINTVPMECVHHPTNAPYICTHNPRYQYTEALGLQNELHLDQNNPTASNISHIRLPSKWAMKSTDKHTIPTNVRILGLLFDPHLTWKDQITKLLKRCNQKIYQLARIANYNEFNLTPNNIWKLYTATIRPIMEYGITTFGGSKLFNKLETIHNKAMRITLKLKSTTPIPNLKSILGCLSLHERKQKLQIKYWHKMTHAPDDLLAYHTFENWLNKANDITDKSTFMDNKLNYNGLNIMATKHFKLAPTTQMYNTLTHIHSQVNFNPKIEYFKSPPCYYSQLPQLTCFDNINDFNEYNGTNTCEIWTDGSCIPNPGPGGSGIYFPTNTALSTRWIAPEETTINFCELKAIHIALETFETNKLYKQYDTCCIFTDSLFCFNLFKSISYPKYYIYYELTIDIINLINIIQYHKCNIIFTKVKSHTDLENNDKADELAKSAAEEAINWKDNKYNNYNKNRSTLVDIHKTTHKWYKQLLITQKKHYYNILHNLNQRNSTFYTKENIFSKGLFDDNHNCIYNTQIFKEEIKHLTKDTIEIINKLRTEHININNYKYHYFGTDSPNCDHCNTIENVSHLLFDCHKYKHQRYKWFIKLTQLNKFFEYPQNRTSVNVLFPIRWQPKINPKDPNYKEINKKFMIERFDIYESITQYIKNINYFENDKY